MARGEVCKTLPEHLVERIIAVMPFPSIFKARCLSKCWRARFSSIASQDDEAKKRVVVSFQKLVGESSRKWKTFSPVLVSSNGELVAYNIETDNWQKLPSISFLPEAVTRCENLQIEGAFLYAFGNAFSFSSTIYVANILTQAWKLLKLPPTVSLGQLRCSKLVVIDRSSETYKLILLCEAGPTSFLAEMYDSKSELWTELQDVRRQRIHPRRLPAQLSVSGWSSTVRLSPILNPPSFWDFNIEEGTFEGRILSSTYGWDKFLWSEDGIENTYYHLVVCNTDQFVVTGNWNKLRRLQKIDVESLRMVELKKVPSVPAALNSDYAVPTVRTLATAPVSDDCHIYFGYMNKRGRQFVRAYRVKDDRWSCPIAAPTISADCNYNYIVSFQPGLSPFLAV